MPADTSKPEARVMKQLSRKFVDEHLVKFLDGASKQMMMVCFTIDVSKPRLECPECHSRHLIVISDQCNDFHAFVES